MYLAHFEHDCHIPTQFPLLSIPPYFHVVDIAENLKSCISLIKNFMQKFSPLLVLQTELM
jgi:hypothetical protein